MIDPKRQTLQPRSSHADRQNDDHAHYHSLQGTRVGVGCKRELGAKRITYSALLFMRLSFALMILEISQSGYFADLERLAGQCERIFQFVDQNGRGVAANIDALKG